MTVISVYINSRLSNPSNSFHKERQEEKAAIIVRFKKNKQ